MMDSQGKGLIKGLENWAKRVTAGYRDVNVLNMSSSFRDGLAFCAVIHHYRPDLIDFDSLSKENIFENNSTAFSVAEKQLGIVALLDAEDMVNFEKPDRLSIITYLSQLYNYFENQNKVKTLKSISKRPVANSSGPPPKVPSMQPKLLTTKRVEVCHVCNNRVFILERLIVDSKLYHRTCFRCSKCNCLLNPGTYVESDSPGLYECAVCVPEETSDSMDTHDAVYDSSEDQNNSLNDIPAKPASPLTEKNALSKSAISESVNNARSSFLQHSLTSKSSPEVKRFSLNLRNGVASIEDTKKETMKHESRDSGVSVKDKISVFEPNRNSKPESFFKASDFSNSSTWTQSSGVPGNDSANKSPRTSAIYSDSFSVSPSKDATSKVETTEKNSAANLDTSDSKDIPKTVDSSPQLNKTSMLQSDELNCDNSTSSSILNKVPSARFKQSLSVQPSKEEETSKISPNRQFSLSDYKSPLKSPRDIFQTNLQPLKLGMPSASSTPKKESTSLPLTPITTPDSSKIGSIEIPQIRSTYSRTLSRPVSYCSLLPNHSNSSSDNSSSNVFQTTPRRSSLDSSSKNSVAATEAGDVTSGSAKSLIEEKTSTSVTFPKEKGTRFQYPGTLGRSDLFKKELSDTPIPSIRHSLELKKFNLSKTFEPSKFDKPTDESVSNVASNETIPSVVSAQKSSKETSESGKKHVVNVEAVKTTATTVEPSKPEKVYPIDLNPFGDEEEEEEYPDDLNPFGDDDEGETAAAAAANVKVVLTKDYDESKNPFASDDDDDVNVTPQPKPKPPFSQTSSPFQQNNSFISPTGSLKGTTKKRLAPKPPKISDIFPNDSQDSEADVSLNSYKSSPAVSRKSLQTPSPKLRKSKPAPPPPPGQANRQMSQTDLAANSKQMKDADNMKIKSNSAAEKEDATQPKKKKRPAPPVPISKRNVNKKIPLKDIIKEMKEIEEKQKECERQGREIELLIRDRDKDEEPSVEEEENIMQLFDLVNQKNALFRRQAELMYIKRSQRLEEQQAELEMQIRELFQKPEAEKSDEDRVREEELILELKDIVDQRSSIIDSIEMDRRRELEEDASVQEQIEIKNGDLPITAEIKEKKPGKVKKKKEKKEKKKKKEKEENENGESKKSSSKRKGLFK